VGRRPGAPGQRHGRNGHRPERRPLIHARKLGRAFGARRVIRDLDLDLARGGFLLVTGPNGSGKTTLLRLVAGLLVPTAGELRVDSQRDRVGFLGHEPLVYRELTALENLELYGRLYRVPERRERIGMLLERFGLWDARNQRADSFSRGMLQRLALCRTLLHDPDLLVLDEPFSALDEEGAALLDRELADLRPRATFVVTTHDPGRVAALATDRLALA
jgi:heme exporter protein A